ncbi:ESCRT-II complex vps25 subunit [Roridomyces roridus]|uniref:ESCRT-II complex vps25 subunit n=1 Tax=Roridomyces roridus TaxID=1738132 RepID=A0AAD7CBN9_9AGAR|nr:ESCRT-II complex vps25 subunit [Roridomyces roridus]
MSFTTPTGFLLPSVHSAPPFFTQQPHPGTHATVTEHWTTLILAYARHRKLFVLRVEDAETTDNEWQEILRNERINRAKNTPRVSFLRSFLPWQPKIWLPTTPQGRHALFCSIGDCLKNGRKSYMDGFTDPPLESPLSNIPMSLLRKAIAVLAKTGRAQLIAVADGEGVRFFQGTAK